MPSLPASVILAAVSIPILPVMAAAQDTIVFPPVPVGISPVLTWILSVVGVIITVAIPIVMIWLKKYLNVQTIATQTGMMDRAVVHAAHIADASMSAQHLTPAETTAGTPIMNRAVQHVATDQGLDMSDLDEAHIAQAILAERHKIQITKAAEPLPRVVLSPVSTVR